MSLEYLIILAVQNICGSIASISHGTISLIALDRDIGFATVISY